MQESFTIESMNPNEAEEIAAMHKQSWRDTYLSPENGVDEEWLDATIDKKFDDTYVPRLKKNIEINHKGEPSFFTAKNQDGKIIGFVRPFVQEDGLQRVGALYIEKAWHGKGVGSALMQKVIEWADPEKPLGLRVTDYNQRARRFYEKWGFEEVPGHGEVIYDKMKTTLMIRKGAK